MPNSTVIKMPITQGTAIQEAKKLTGDETALLRYLNRHESIGFFYDEFGTMLSGDNNRLSELHSLGFSPKPEIHFGVIDDKTLSEGLHILLGMVQRGLVVVVKNPEKMYDNGKIEITETGKAILGARIVIDDEEAGPLRETFRQLAE